MPPETRYEVNKPDVVDESVDGEVLIVHLGTGSYYSSRGAGDVAWQLVAKGATAAEAARAMGREAADVEPFVSRLLEEELIRERRLPCDDLPAVSAVAGALELEKYTDMQELLILDPIHDVEEAGWPKAKPAAAGD